MKAKHVGKKQIIKLTKKDLGKTVVLRNGERHKVESWDDKDTRLPVEIDGCWYDENGISCIGERELDVVSRVTRGRPKKVKVEDAPIQDVGIKAPIMTATYEIEHLQAAFDALRVLEEGAKRRCLDWLNSKLASEGVNQ